jgi:hypothetical protein
LNTWMSSQKEFNLSLVLFLYNEFMHFHF